jgi:hypothetical protein
MPSTCPGILGVTDETLCQGRAMTRPAVVLLLLACAAAARAEDTVVLIEFESREPMDGWSSGRLGLAEVSVREGATPTGGRTLKIIRSADASKTGYLPP